MKYRKYDILKNDNLYIANSFANNGYLYLISSDINDIKKQIDNELKELKQANII